jgi:hypothetical protein
MFPLRYLNLDTRCFSFLWRPLSDSAPSLLSLCFLWFASLMIPHSFITGSLPDSWSKLSQLTSLSLSGNQLSGSLPTSWAALTSLFRFGVDSNDIIGVQPAFILSTIICGRWNYLLLLATIGALPVEYCSWTQMSEFYASSNRLSGT